MLSKVVAWPPDIALLLWVVSAVLVAVAVSSKLVQQLEFSMAEMSVLVILLPLVVVAAAGVSAS